MNSMFLRSFNLEIIRVEFEFILKSLTFDCRISYLMNESSLIFEISSEKKETNSSLQLHFNQEKMQDT